MLRTQIPRPTSTERPPSYASSSHIALFQGQIARVVHADMCFAANEECPPCCNILNWYFRQLPTNCVSAVAPAKVLDSLMPVCALYQLDRGQTTQLLYAAGRNRCLIPRPAGITLLKAGSEGSARRGVTAAPDWAAV